MEFHRTLKVQWNFTQHQIPWNSMESPRNFLETYCRESTLRLRQNEHFAYIFKFISWMKTFDFHRKFIEMCSFWFNRGRQQRSLYLVVNSGTTVLASRSGTNELKNNRIWWLCLVPTSTTSFASDLGYRMAKNLIGLYKENTFYDQWHQIS